MYMYCSVRNEEVDMRKVGKGGASMGMGLERDGVKKMRKGGRYVKLNV